MATADPNLNSSSTSGDFPPRPIRNSNYYVTRSDGTVVQGVLLESRTTDNGMLECFVHYHGMDRRHDEWIPAQQVDLERQLRPEDVVGATPQVPALPESGRLTRTQKRKYHEINCLQDVPEEHLDGYSQMLEQAYQNFTRVKYTEKIQFGHYEINTWYFSPYPLDFKRCTKLWICEFCLKYMRHEVQLQRHSTKCKKRHPPGKEIYRKGLLSVFEVDGVEQELYCQSLCLLGKLFLDHKTLYYDVASFMFYVLCHIDRTGYHLVGYFSKEKYSVENNNLACIMTLPPHQRHGYGKFLIDFSYELAKIEKCVGGPEKPLSDLGRLSYRSYWEYSIFNYLTAQSLGSVKSVYVEEISNATAIAVDDVISVLEAHSLLKHHRMGKFVDICPKDLQDFFHEHQKKQPLRVDPKCLRWSPPIKS